MSNIIELSAMRAARSPAAVLPTEGAVDMLPGRTLRQRILQSPEPETETGKNSRLRMARREAWWNAERQVDYWKVCMKMHDAISIVQRAGLPEGDNHQKAEHWQWHPIAENYRRAVARLFLTPASTQLNIAWKKKALAAEEHKYTGLSSERIEAAIALDIEFLKAHPTRRSRSPQQ